MIEALNISKSFGDHKVLNDVSFRFETGKCNLIIGQSGSGKTVLMKCLVGLFEIDSGNVMYDDRMFSRMSFDEMKVIRQEIGMLFQGGALFDSMTVEENIIFPLSMFTNQTTEEKRDRANFCLSRVNLVNVNKLFPSEIKLLFNVGLSRFDKIKESDFGVSVDYNSIVADVNSLVVTIYKQPEFVQNIRINPERVEFLIETD